jgi:hypothetical protein
MQGQDFLCYEAGYMDLAPPGASKGDLICILYGCKLPFVLRKQQEQYLLVGSCYVYGMMHGEVLESVRSGKLSIRRMDLR